MNLRRTNFAGAGATFWSAKTYDAYYRQLCSQAGPFPKRLNSDPPLYRPMGDLGLPTTGRYAARKPRAAARVTGGRPTEINTLTFGAADKPERYKDYAFPDGYTYRQFENGDIAIVASPKTKRVTWLYATEATPAWTAITETIRAERDGKVTRTTLTVLDTVNKLLAPFVPAATPKGRGGVKRVQETAPVVEEPSSTIPWVPLAIGGGVVMIALFLRGGRR